MHRYLYRWIDTFFFVVSMGRGWRRPCHAISEPIARLRRALAMVWKLIATTALWGAFPQHKVAVLAGSAAWSAVQHVRAKREKKRTSWDENTSLDAGAGAQEAEGIEWSDVRCELLRKDGTVDKEILRGINGRTGAGRLTCLMGPSGSGKTTLLSILARQMPSNKRMRLVGKYYIGGHTAEYSRLRIAFVQQEDLFYSQLTVRETLRMSAKLRGQDESCVEEIIKTLGLVNCANTIVGDSKTRGISGGEKKRLSIGVELLGNPSIIFLDEPTTGLDSFQAESVVATLRELSNAGHTVICSIHQPKSAIFGMFDDMVLLAEGMCIYSGPLEEAESYFSTQGHPCPNLCNPAEHYIDLVSMDYSSDEREEATQSRILKLAAAWRGHYNHQRKPLHSTTDLKKDAELSTKLVPTKRGGIFTQVRLLLARSWRQIRRDKATNLVRLNTSLFSALLFGSIFYKLPFTQVSIQDRMGLLQVSCINAAMTALTKTLNAFPREATIVGRERAKKLYNVGPYFASKLLAELPISAIFPAIFGAVVYPMAGLNKNASRFLQFLGIVTLESFTSASLGLAVGSVAPSTEAAMAIGPSVMVLFIGT